LHISCQSEKDISQLLTKLDFAMLKVVMETSSYVYCSGWFRAGNHPVGRFILPRYALIFDELHYFAEPLEGDLLLGNPYAKLAAIAADCLSLSKEANPPTEEQLEALRIALGDEPGGEGGEYAYFGTMALLEFTKKAGGYFYVLPGLREPFVNFCSSYKTDFLAEMKMSSLACNIIDFLFEQQIPAFDPIKSAPTLNLFTDFKEDFQKGILSYANKFRGSYELSDEQKNYIKETLAVDEQRLLEFMQPENLRQFNISKLSLLGDALGLFVPLPLGTLIEVGKEIRRVRAFENANLNFILSLAVLKKITNVGEVERPSNCAVCNVSPAEIENMTDEQCDKIMYSDELCIKHMVAILDLKKRFGLYGKNRLREMKRLGDLSVWMEPDRR